MPPASENLNQPHAERRWSGSSRLRFAFLVFLDLESRLIMGIGCLIEAVMPCSLAPVDFGPSRISKKRKSFLCGRLRTAVTMTRFDQCQQSRIANSNPRPLPDSSVLAGRMQFFVQSEPRSSNLWTGILFALRYRGCR